MVVLLVGLGKGATWAYLILFLVKLQNGKKYQKILLALKTPIYSKGESKQLFKLYLNRLGFSKEGIRDEVDLYTKSMQDDEEFIKESDGWKPYLIKYVYSFWSPKILTVHKGLFEDELEDSIHKRKAEVKRKKKKTHTP